MLNYIGKFDCEAKQQFHPAVFHCLDVAAVAKAYIDKSKPLQNRLITIIKSQLSELSDKDAIDLILFLISIHDLGKFDARFQCKEQFKTLYKSFHPVIDDETVTTTGYDHGSAGYRIFERELEHYGFNIEFFDVFNGAIIDVMGHHGECNFKTSHLSGARTIAGDEYYDTDLKARIDFVLAMKELFIPNLDFLDDYEDQIDDGFELKTGLLAGLCCVCDWIGSNTHYFKFTATSESIEEYFKNVYVPAQKAINYSGLYQPVHRAGFSELYPSYTPQSVQTCLNKLPLEYGLTIVEADAGSGKTEVAFSYASLLMREGLADSIVFALPSQATANAMFSRVEEAAEKIFNKSNVVLAHGNAGFNELFNDLKDRAYHNTDESSVQCSRWLAESKKRTMLSQVGICTIDQVLMSVLAIRHQFVRGFGVKKSVLVIDEAHAYDGYMYGLLCEVLKDCAEAFSSVIIMTATLPAYQKKMLLESYGYNKDISSTDDYPLVTHYTPKTGISRYTPTVASRKKQIKVIIHASEACEPDDVILQEIKRRVEGGYRIALICNTVNSAFEQLRSILPHEFVDMFHSRYTYRDRQRIENNCLDLYGKGSRKRHGNRGSVLVATQVIEQSIDLDFDWIVTQLCPIDLLFQRAGRLGRHEDDNVAYRPLEWKGHELTVIAPPAKFEGDYGEDARNSPYGSSAFVYSNARALRRTEKYIERNQLITFPEHFRLGVEEVYQLEPLENEHSSLKRAYELYEAKYLKSNNLAKSLAKSNATPLPDTDEAMKLMTREGDISGTALLLNHDRTEFIDGTPFSWDILNSKGRKAINMLENISLNSVSLTKKMEKLLATKFNEDIGMHILNMDKIKDMYMESEIGYSHTVGLMII